MGAKKLPSDFKFLEDMYTDSYFPTFLVDKIKNILQDVISFLESGNTNIELIQQELDKAVVKINALQEEFDNNDSELETVARESIADTVEKILQYFNIDIETEEAIREREW